MERKPYTKAILSCFLFILLHPLFAQNIILQDTSGQRGMIVEQPLLGIIPEKGKSVTIVFRYNYRSLVWRGMRVDTGFAVQCVTPAIISQNVDEINGTETLAVRCDSLQKGEYGIAIFRWEILASPDSITSVEILSVEVDNVRLHIVKPIGYISITSPPVHEIPSVTLHIVGENPVKYRLQVQYKVPGESNVQFDIYNLAGDKIQPIIQKIGADTMYFDFEEKFANGLYFLVMRTERGDYVLPFTLMR